MSNAGKARADGGARCAAVSAGAVVVLALVLAGCAGEVADAEPSAQSTPAPVGTVSTPGDSAAREALQYAAEHSVAHLYLRHQANLFEAGLDGGMHVGESSVDEIDGGYEMCDVIDECNKFTGFVIDDGLVTDLRVNGQDPGPRMAVGDGTTVESRGVTATFLTAYRSIAGESLFVAIELSTGEVNAELYVYSATYRAPDGRQRQAADVLGPFEVGAQSTATVAMAFPAAEPGGTVTLEGIVDDDYDKTVELVIPVG